MPQPGNNTSGCSSPTTGYHIMINGNNLLILYSAIVCEKTAGAYIAVISDALLLLNI
jgi:hypothetical protein